MATFYVEQPPVNQGLVTFDKRILTLIGKVLHERIINDTEDKVAAYINGIRKGTLKTLFEFKVGTEPNKVKTTQRKVHTLPTTLRWKGKDSNRKGDDDDDDELDALRRELLPASIDRGYHNIVLTLLESGCDPYLKGKKGSPLEIATANGNLAVINKIMSFYEATVNDEVRGRVKSQIQSSLEIACRTGNSEAVQCLISHLKRVCEDSVSNLEFDDEFNPISAAYSEGHDDIVRQILYLLWVESQESQDKLSDDKPLPLQLLAKWGNKSIRSIHDSWLQPENTTAVLVSIDVSHNPLENIPGRLLNGLPHLKVLNISHCSLRKMPVLFPDTTVLRLQTLDLSHNLLKTIPVEVFMIPSLRSLNLEDNRLESIERGIGKMHGILDWRCSHLNTLSFSHNRLKEIPDKIAAATELKHLRLANNQLETFPLPWKCPLDTLDVSNNNLDSLRDMDIYWKLTLTKLNLAHNKFRSVPSTVCQLVALKELNVSHNMIKTLPRTQEWRTSDLSILNLSENQLTFVDDEVMEVWKQDKTDTISKQRFWKKHTGQKEVPDWFQEADLGDQQLVFPTTLQKSLDSLNLSSNRLQAVPDSVCDMRNLKILNLSGNNLVSRLPLQLGVLQELFSLKLEGIVINDPPTVTKLLSKTKCDAMTVTSSLREQLLDFRSYRGIKLMVIGPKGSGKTTLINRLMDISEPTSKKVTVKEWTRKRATSLAMAIEPVVFTVWDIEGGVFNSTISQTLFTPNTIYLLVWDAAKGSINEIPSWILNVKLMAPRSPIIAVASHVDALIKSSNEPTGEPKLRANLNSTLSKMIFDELYVDAYHPSGRGIQKLKRLIFETAISMETQDANKPKQMVPLIGRKVPKVFLSMRTKLTEKLKEQQREDQKTPRLMTEVDFSSLLNSIPEKSELVYGKQQVTAGIVEFLRDTGSLIHISDHTYRLTNVYFLDPDWLCNALLDAAQHMGSSHTIEKDELRMCAKKYGFDDTQFEDYLQLLGRFEIALKASDERYILPLLLTEKKPYVDGIKPILASMFEFSLMRWYKMSFVPTGFMSRLVCRILADMNQPGQVQQEQRKPFKPMGERTMAWQEGIVIASSHQQINVELMSVQDGSPCICLSIQSDDNELLRKGVGFIVDHIEYLLKEWYSEHIKEVERMVPCHLCVKAVLGTVKELADIEMSCAVFQMTHLTLEATLEKKEDIKCLNSASGHTLHLRDLIPDLYLYDLGVTELHDVPRFNDERSTPLGEGSFGVVYKSQIEGKARALKSLLKRVNDETVSTQDLSENVLLHFPDFRREVAMMSRLKHPCILKLIGVSMQSLCFVMELAPLGDLSSFLDDQYISSTPEISTAAEFHGTILDRMLTFKIAFQIFASVEYLHQEGITHTDLKTNNILMFSDNPEDKVNVKLTDYGISQAHGTAGVVRGHAGTHSYVAPEIIKGKAFNEKVDIFSIGMILYHLVTGVHPGGGRQFRPNRDDNERAIQANFSFPDFTMKPDFKCLEMVMEECWKENPDERKSASEMLHKMNDAGFLCLMNVEELDGVQDVCFCKPSESEGTRTSFRGFWSLDESNERHLTEINLDSFKQTEPINLKGPKISCSTVTADLYIAGTHSKGIHVFQTKRGGAVTRGTLERSVELAFDVRCLVYLACKKQSSSEDTQTGHLYAGLEDGKLVMYEHSYSAYSLTWSLPTALQLTNTLKPCRCMCSIAAGIANSEVLLVGCGDEIVTVNTKDQKVDGSIFVQSVPGRNQFIVQIIQFQGNILCFLSESSDVYQFRLSDQKLVATFRCGLECPLPDLNILEEKRSSLPSTRRRPFGDDSTKTVKLGSRRPKTHFGSCLEVHSLLVVKDTLWIGRSGGDILVVALGDSEVSKFGQILTVLDVNHLIGLKGGPVKHLLKTESENVVAVRKVMRQPGGTIYQILLWQGWGCKSVARFAKSLDLPSDDD